LMSVASPRRANDFAKQSLVSTPSDFEGDSVGDRAENEVLLSAPLSLTSGI
jgi:hypothetical protein